MYPSVLAIMLPITNTTKLQESTTSWQKRWSGTIALIGAGNWNGTTSLRRKGRLKKRKRDHTFIDSGLFYSLESY